MEIPESQRGPDRNAVGRDTSQPWIPILLGREFRERDDEGAPKVAIVNEAFARFYFGSESPIGRRIDQMGTTGAPR
jgi:hypothetical protein